MHPASYTWVSYNGSIPVSKTGHCGSNPQTCAKGARKACGTHRPAGRACPGVKSRCGRRFSSVPRTAYRAGVTAARSALTRSEEVQSLCPVPYGSIAKLVKATDCRSVTARSNRAGTSIRRCTQAVEESAPEKRQAGDCAWVQILPSAPFTPLVQLAERRTYNSEVRSSNLRGRTNRAPDPGGPCAPIWENA